MTPDSAPRPTSAERRDVDLAALRIEHPADRVGDVGGLLTTRAILGLVQQRDEAIRLAVSARDERDEARATIRRLEAEGAGLRETTTKQWQAIRPRSDDGTVDDVAIDCDLFRLEQMSEDAWWASAIRGEGKGSKQTMFWLQWDKKLKRIVCTCYDDEIGCVDDSRPHDEERPVRIDDLRKRANAAEARVAELEAERDDALTDRRAAFQVTVGQRMTITTLERREAALRAALEALTAKAPIHSDEFKTSCACCDGNAGTMDYYQPDEFPHEGDCPWVKARAVLATPAPAGGVTLTAGEQNALLHVLNDDALATNAFVEEGAIYDVLYTLRAKLRGAGTEGA